MNWHIFSLFDNSDFVILHNLDLEEMHFLNFITFPLEWFYILTLLIPFHNYITLHHIWNVTLLYLHCVKFITFSWMFFMFWHYDIKLRCIKLHYITFHNFSSLVVLYPGFTKHHITLHAITFQHITFTYITFHFITFLPEWFYILPLLNISVGCFQGNRFRSYKMSFLYYTQEVKSERVPFWVKKSFW